MYDGTPELRAKRPGLHGQEACSRLARDNDITTLLEAFGDPEWVEQFRLDRLAEVAPIEPRYTLSFSGTGDATVTISGDDGMMQRHVTLPYAEDVPIAGFLTANVTQIVTEGGVGCSITAFSNQHRDGITVAEVAAVEGQTLAMCTPRD